MPDRRTVLKTLWHLENHPFDPTRDSDGKGLPAPVFDGPLDPRSDTRLLDYYFREIYDSERAGILTGLDSKVDSVYAPRGKRPDGEALLVLICGFKRTGKTSLENRLLHGMSVALGTEPLLVRASLTTRDPLANGKLLAKRFRDVFTKQYDVPDKATLKEIYDEEKEDATADEEPFASFFDRVRDELVGHFDKPIVFQVTGADYVDHYDTWKALYGSIKRFAECIIVVTPQSVYARSCADEVGANVALFEARQLDVDGAISYLRHRLSRERENGDEEADMSPFLPEAVKLLYRDGAPVPEYGPNKFADEPVRHPVKDLNKMFKDALDEVLARVPDAADAAALEALDPAAFTVSEEIMGQVCGM